MHILAPKPPEHNFQMFFNVDQSVGQNAVNANPDDIMLVQFLIKRLGERLPVVSPGGHLRKARAMKVPLTGFCCPATIDGIKAWQEGWGAAVDGRVSSARGYRYGSGVWTIVSLNATFRKHFPEAWPMLRNAPPPLSGKIKQIL